MSEIPHHQSNAGQHTSSASQPGPHDSICFAHLFTFTTWKHSLPLVIALIASILSGAIRTSLSIILGEVFGIISSHGAGALSGPETISKISSWCTIMAIAGGLGWLVNFTLLFSWVTFSELQAQHVKRRVFSALLRKDMPWHDLQPNGISSVLVRTQSQIRELQSTVSIGLGNLSTDATTATANLIVAFSFSWRLTLVVLATLPPSLIILHSLGRGLKPAIESQKRELALASKHAISAITAIDLVKTYNGTDQEVWQYSNTIKRSMRAYLVQSRTNAYQMSYVKFWLEGIFVLGFFYGVVLANQGLGAGTVVTTFYAALGALQAIESFMPMYPMLAKGMSAGQALQRIADNSSTCSGIPKEVEYSKLHNSVAKIKFHNVSFAYPSNPSLLVLEDASLSFAPRRFTFLVGPSGSGKSTLGDLLIKLYSPSEGDITIDGVSFRALNTDWLRSKITLIQQHSINFDDTIFKNIALGLSTTGKAKKSDIEAVCEATRLHSSIMNLSNGLEARIGSHRHNMSGGQTQRLALARALLRNPEVLILDEVTSGLDLLSQSHVMNVIREWRRNKTTIIITHDTAHIQAEDFVYAVDGGRVVQEGLWQVIEKNAAGLLAQLMSPDGVNHDQSPCTSRSSERDGKYEIDAAVPTSSLIVPSRLICPTPAMFWPRTTPATPGYLGPGMTLEVTSPTVNANQSISQYQWHTPVFETLLSPRKPTSSPLPAKRTRRSRTTKASLPNFRKATYTTSTPRNPNAILKIPRKGSRNPWNDCAIQEATVLRPEIEESSLAVLEKQDDDARQSRIDLGRDNTASHYMERNGDKLPLLLIYRTVWPYLEVKERFYLVVGILSCFVVASSVPIFSVIFANLLSALYAKNDTVSAGQKWSLLLLAVAVVGASMAFLMHHLMQYSGQAWVNALRTEAFSRVLKQDRPFFDKPKHGPVRIVECIDCSAEETRNLVGRFAPGLICIAIMVLVTVIWAAVISWKLTLVTLSSGPLLIAATKGYSHVSYKWELRCNLAAEATFAIVTETILNIRVVKALSLEHHFSEKHNKSVSHAYDLGIRKAIWTAALFACWRTMIWFMMALTFYYATVLLAVQNSITVDKVLKVVNLLVLGLSAASEMLESIPNINAAQATAARLLYYANLQVSEEESDNHDPKLAKAKMTKRQSAKAKKKLISPFPVRMDGLSFTYAQEGNSVQSVLNNVTLEINAGTATAIVGPSGCGKSTLASLLLTTRQPRHIPQVRNIRPSIHRHPLSFAGLPPELVDLTTLRSQIAYLPQQPFLFPTTIGRNITYGLSDTDPLLELSNIERAARKAGILDFVDSLPDGFDTLIGEGSQGVSGGQAQRICLARALVRRPKLLILDEPTSALDPVAAEGVRRTISRLITKATGTQGMAPSPLHGRYVGSQRRWKQMGFEEGVGLRNSELAVVVITHSVEMMKVCERVAVLDQGRIVEQGSFRDLLNKRGRLVGLIGEYVTDDKNKKRRSR